jgi:hypothetical protein
MAKSRVHFSVEEVDHGWNRLAQVLEELRKRKSYVKAGVLGAGRDRDEGDVTNVELAIIHEFGAPSVGVPQRSFVRSSFDAKRGQYIEDLRKLLRGVYEGKVTIEQALNIVGLHMATDMKKGITEGPGIPPPNSESTLRRKLGKSRPGSRKDPRPLVDTGRMVDSISHQVVMSGEEEHE